MLGVVVIGVSVGCGYGTNARPDGAAMVIQVAGCVGGSASWLNALVAVLMCLLSKTGSY